VDDSTFLSGYVGQFVSQGRFTEHFIGDLLEGLRFSQLPAARCFLFLRCSGGLIGGHSFLLPLGGDDLGSGVQQFLQFDLRRGRRWGRLRPKLLRQQLPVCRRHDPSLVLLLGLDLVLIGLLADFGLRV
jgi:hypothetical protein